MLKLTKTVEYALISINYIEKNTEDSQFFILLEDAPLYEGEYTPIGNVIYGIEVLEKIKYDHKSEYVLRPDFINTFQMYN